MSAFRDIAQEVGEIIAATNEAYGSSFAKAGEFLRLLYPDGLTPAQYDDALLLVRVFDKQMRIATDRDALGESPYADLAGYGILGVHLHHQRKEREAWQDSVSGPNAQPSPAGPTPGSAAPSTSAKTTTSASASSGSATKPRPSTPQESSCGEREFVLVRTAMEDAAIGLDGHALANSQLNAPCVICGRDLIGLMSLCRVRRDHRKNVLVPLFTCFPSCERILDTVLP